MKASHAIVSALAFVASCTSSPIEEAELDPPLPPPLSEPEAAVVGSEFSVDAFVLATEMDVDQGVRLRNGPYELGYPCWKSLSPEARFDLGYRSSKSENENTETLERGRSCRLTFVPSSASFRVIALPEDLPGESLVELGGWSHPFKGHGTHPCTKGTAAPEVPEELKMLRTCPEGARVFVDTATVRRALAVRDVDLAEAKARREERRNGAQKEFLRRRAARAAEAGR